MDEGKELSRFDVAIWQSWPPSECEIPFIGLVSAPDAAAAVVAVMRVFGVTRAGHVAAIDQARRFQHRAYGVQIAEQEPGLVVQVAQASERVRRSGGAGGSRKAYQASWELEASLPDHPRDCQEAGISDAALGPLTERSDGGLDSKSERTGPLTMRINAEPGPLGA